MPRRRKNTRQEAQPEAAPVGTAAQEQKMMRVKLSFSDNPTTILLAQAKNIDVKTVPTVQLGSNGRAYVEMIVRQDTLVKSLELGATEVIGDVLVFYDAPGSLCQSATPEIIAGTFSLEKVVERFQESLAKREQEGAEKEARENEARAKLEVLTEEVARVHAGEDPRGRVVPAGYYLDVVQDYGHIYVRVFVDGRTYYSDKFPTIDEAIAYIGGEIARAAESEREMEKESARTLDQAMSRPTRMAEKAKAWWDRVKELAADPECQEQMELAKLRMTFYERLAKVPWDVEIVEKKGVRCIPLADYKRRIPREIGLTKPEWADRLEIWEPVDDDDPWLIALVEVEKGGREFFKIAEW